MEDEWLDYYSEISNLEDYNEDFNENMHGEGFIDRKFKFLIIISKIKNRKSRILELLL